MLQVHFTAQDLLQVEVRTEPAPLMELGLAAAMLQRPDHPAVFGRWRREVRSRLVGAAMPLFSLVPPNGAGPLFLDPLSTTVEEGLEEVMGTPDTAVVAELRRVSPAYRPITPWVQALYDRDRAAWRDLGVALRSAYGVLVEPEWERARQTYAADVAWRSRLLASRGLGQMLTSLYPRSSWSGSSLQIPLPRSAELTLTGQGLTLMPSTVWRGEPLVGDDGKARPLLLYPALTALPQAATEEADEPLAALLGRTRAAVLRALDVPRTTGGLARDLQISLASASQHTTTLRSAGLVSSTRQGKCVWHVRTPLGAELARTGAQPIQDGYPPGRKDDATHHSWPT